MKRLCSNMSKELRIEIEKQIEDNTLKSRWLRQQATQEFNTAKILVNLLCLAPTNDLLYKIYNYFLDGHLDINKDINVLIDDCIDLLVAENIISRIEYNEPRYNSINQALTGN